MVDVWPRARGFPLDDVDLHVPDLDSHQEEVDLAYDHVFQVIPETLEGERGVRCGESTLLPGHFDNSCGLSQELSLSPKPSGFFTTV